MTRIDTQPGLNMPCFSHCSYWFQSILRTTISFSAIKIIFSSKTQFLLLGMSEPTEIVNNYLTTAIIECSGDREKVESLTKLLLFVHNEVNEASRYGGNFHSLVLIQTLKQGDWLLRVPTSRKDQMLKGSRKSLACDIVLGRSCI